MENLENVYFDRATNSKSVIPFRFNYTQNGHNKSWDLLQTNQESVNVLIYNRIRRVLILIKKFRPAIYFNCIAPEDRYKPVDTQKYPAKLGLALEMCAGIVDKNKPIEVIAREEVLEECGYDVPVTGLQKITSYRSGVGVEGALQTFYYCEVTDDMKSEQGGGVDDEIIDIVEMSIPEVERYVAGPGPLPSPPSCLFALMWFLHHKAAQYKKSFERTCGECKIDELAKKLPHM